MPGTVINESQTTLAGDQQDDRSGRVIAFFAKAAQNSSRITAQGIDMLLGVAEDSVVSGSKAKDQLQSLKSKVEFFQAFERKAKAYGVLLNDLPGVEGIEQQENQAKEYVKEFISTLQVDAPTDVHTRQLAKLDLLIKVVADAAKNKQNGEVDVTCPISGEKMSDPIRNMVCGHVYDKRSIEQYMEKRRKARQAVKCPVEGCEENREVSWEILVPDPAMRKAIDRAYFAEVMRESEAATD